VQFGRAGIVQSHFAEQLIVVIDERYIHFDGFAHAGIGKVFGNASSIRVVGQLLPDLRQIVLAIGILDVIPE
jgi:hypothetical protein